MLTKGKIRDCTVRDKSVTDFVMTITTEMAPTSRLVCWFEYMNGENEYEIISDSVNFNVGDMFKNKVIFNMTKAVPYV